MSKTYYTLLVRDNADAPWAIDFGDYDRDCVNDARDDATEREYKKGNTKIIATPDDQSAIVAAVTALNTKGA